jgi:hypothetical protein
MKAGIFFTGSGPILALTCYDSFLEPNLIEKLQSKGIKKFIAYEIPIGRVRDVYGARYETVMNDVKQQDDLRVLDDDGHHVFYNFSIMHLGAPVYHEERPVPSS